MSENVSSKKRLRTALLGEREKLSRVLWRERSDEICRHVAAWIVAHDTDQVFAFASHRQEPDLAPLGAMLPDDVPLALPVIIGRGTMRFYRHQPDDVLTANRHGILEPHPHHEMSASAKTLVLVPCVACDEQGYRLGYGGGFYDRFLAAHPGVVSLGVVFAGFFTERLPSEAHDQPLNGVVTEEGVTLFSRKQ